MLLVVYREGKLLLHFLTRYGELVKTSYEEEGELLGSIYLCRVEGFYKNLGAYLLNCGEFRALLQDGKERKEGDYLIVKVKKLLRDKRLPKVSEEVILEGLRESYPPRGEVKDKGELERLRSIYLSFKDKLKLRRLGLLYKPPPLYLRVALKEGVKGVISNSPRVLLEFRNLGFNNLKFERDFKKIFEVLNIKEPLKEIVKDTFFLEDGSYVYMDKGRAFTTFDVNSGRSGEEPLKINQRATELILKQIKIKGLGGTILIDYLKLKEEERENFLKFLRQKLKENGLNFGCLHLSPLWIAQICLKREREGLYELLRQSCPCCGGKGFRLKLNLGDGS